MKSIIGIRLYIMLLAIMLVGMVIVPSVNGMESTIYNSENTRMTIINNVLPDLEPKDMDWLLNHNIITTYGVVPSFQDNEQKQNWIKDLCKITTKPIPELDRFLYPNGSVFGYGVNYLGCIEVFWLENDEVNQTSVNDIYQIFDEHGKMIEIDNIPVIFISSSLVKPNIDRDDTFRPIIGGVQVQASDGVGYYLSTIGFAAERDSDQQKGYVITGHIPDIIGLDVYQPLISSYAGTASDAGVYYADAAFVPFDNVEATIMDISGNIVAVEDYCNPFTDYDVYMSGIATQSSGVVMSRGVAVYHDYYGYYLYDQSVASYSSAGGDSGAPVYWYNQGASNELLIGGIHWGNSDLGSFFSPIDHVHSELDVTILH